MTRHAEMERPDEVQEAEFAATPHHGSLRPVMRDGVLWVWRMSPGHRRPYSRLCERNVFDPTYRPRHMSHRAEGAAS